MEKDQKYWFALYTRPRSEFKAAERISAKGIICYLPTVEKIKQWSDRRKKIVEPLFKSYLFINATEKERILSLQQYGIVRCIADHGRAAKIPEWQIENLKRLLKYHSEFLAYDGIVPGIKVKIKEGPFAGVVGVVTQTARGKALAVSIEFINRSVTAHLPGDSIVEVLRQ